MTSFLQVFHQDREDKCVRRIHISDHKCLTSFSTCQSVDLFPLPTSAFLRHLMSFLDWRRIGLINTKNPWRLYFLNMLRQNDILSFNTSYYPVCYRKIQQLCMCDTGNVSRFRRACTAPLVQCSLPKFCEVDCWLYCLWETAKVTCQTYLSSLHLTLFIPRCLNKQYPTASYSVITPATEELQNIVGTHKSCRVYTKRPLSVPSAEYVVIREIAVQLSG